MPHQTSDPALQVLRINEEQLRGFINPKQLKNSIWILVWHAVQDQHTTGQFRCGTPGY